jgi:hypothetical protein
MERSSTARARKVRRTLYPLILPLPSPHGRSPDLAPTADPTLRARLGAAAGTLPCELTSVPPPVRRPPLRACSAARGAFPPVLSGRGERPWEKGQGRRRRREGIRPSH